jgi:hypothetical protein
MSGFFLVYAQHGGPWDWSRGLREQDLWDEHALFMDGLVEDGFVVLGGPLDEKDVLLVVASDGEAAVETRFAADPWIANGMLSISAIRPWTVLLDGRRAGTSSG